MTKEIREYVDTYRTIGYEEIRPTKTVKVFPKPAKDPEEDDLDYEVGLAFDFTLESEAPLTRHVAPKAPSDEDSWMADPAWLQRFDDAAEASFAQSFAEFLDEEEGSKPAFTIPSRAELDEAMARLRLEHGVA